MHVADVTTQGLMIMRRGMEDLARHARTLASAPVEDDTAGLVEDVEALVGLRAATHLVRAGARVVEVGESLTGTLIDLRA